MDNKEFTLSVYNTITKEYENVVVTEDVFNTYRRSYWNEDNNDKLHRKEIPFSNLKCCEDGSIDNFREFASEQDNPEKIIEEKFELELVIKALEILTAKEKITFVIFAFYDMSQNKIARLLSVNQSTVNRNLKRAIEKLKK